MPLTLSIGFVYDIIAFPHTFPYMFTSDVLSTCRLCRSLLNWTGGATSFSVCATNIDVSANDAFDSGFALDILSPPLDCGIMAVDMFDSRFFILVVLFALT